MGPKPAQATQTVATASRSQGLLKLSLACAMKALMTVFPVPRIGVWVQIWHSVPQKRIGVGIHENPCEY